MTLHPSEHYRRGTYITVIELERDVSLLFMISILYNSRIISALRRLVGNPNILNKYSSENIKIWLPYLQMEKLDGWFSSIDNQTTVEIAIKNDTSILKIVESDIVEYDWNISTFMNDADYYKIIPKNWGTKYPISSLIKPVKFVINSRFKLQIEKYINMIKEKEPRGTAFSILLENSEITYFDAPLQTIQWL